MNAYLYIRTDANGEFRVITRARSNYDAWTGIETKLNLHGEKKLSANGRLPSCRKITDSAAAKQLANGAIEI